jgi:hypothetical protein
VRVVGRDPGHPERIALGNCGELSLILHSKQHRPSALGPERQNLASVVERRQVGPMRLHMLADHVGSARVRDPRPARDRASRACRKARASLSEWEAFAEALRPGFETIDGAIEAVTSMHRDVTGEVSVGAPGPFTRLWLRPRVSRLLSAHEGLRLVVAFGTPRELEHRLADRALDLAILVRPVELPGIEAAPIFTETFRAYASPGAT